MAKVVVGKGLPMTDVLASLEIGLIVVQKAVSVGPYELTHALPHSSAMVDDMASPIQYSHLTLGISALLSDTATEGVRSSKSTCRELMTLGRSFNKSFCSAVQRVKPKVQARKQS
jgi:hypothetical protein